MSFTAESHSTNFTSTLDRIVDLKRRDPYNRRAPKVMLMTKNFCMAQPFLGQAGDETVTN